MIILFMYFLWLQFNMFFTSLLGKNDGGGGGGGVVLKVTLCGII